MTYAIHTVRIGHDDIELKCSVTYAMNAVRIGHDDQLTSRIDMVNQIEPFNRLFRLQVDTLPDTRVGRQG